MHSSTKNKDDIPSTHGCADTGNYLPNSVTFIYLLDKGKAPTLTVKTLNVAPPTLNIRNSPNGKIIGTINQGVPVVIYQEQDGWSRISADNDTEKWVANQYLCAEQDCEHF